VLKKAIVPAALCLLGLCGGAAAADLALLIPNLYGPGGLHVDSEALLPDGSTHSAHFNSSFQQSFTPFNEALATQLSSVPVPTPASGFTYSFDASAGVFKRSTQSFGSILSDRAETIGRGKLSFGLHYQRFTFDSIDGVDLGSVPVVFTHDDPTLSAGRHDVVTTSNLIKATLDQTVFFATYGLTDRLDLSAAIPLAHVDLSATSNATVQRIGTASSPLTHFFFQPDGTVGTQKTFSSTGSATGIGDILLRIKGTIVKQGATGLALGLEGRIPTGDEMNLLGSGAASVKPFAAFSYSGRTLSPHVKLGYQWNGKSVLAGDPATGEKKDLPDIFIYEAGADVALAKPVTLAVDLLGRNVINGQRLSPETFHALDGTSTFPTSTFVTQSYNMLNGAVGIKVNPGANFLLDFNVTFKLNDAGLRDKVTPLVGIEYSF
jgi:outer membrane putative beta-barrel porin/alpha-amylase